MAFILFVIFQTGCIKKSESQVYIGSTAVDTTTIISNLDTPWEILWGPDNYIWFTERQGKVSRLNPETGERNIILTIDDVFENGEGGLLGMVLHPDFPEQPIVYLVYNYASGALIRERLVRYTWNGGTLVNQEILINDIEANSYHDGSRLAFGPYGKLYMSTGDAGNTANSQNTNSLNGKILRINPDGSIPSDNPFPDSYIWASGLRNSQGLVFSPDGYLYGSDHGPSTDDEINLLEQARNYGWPDITGFCDQPGEITYCNNNNIREPLAAWTPTLAVAGIDYYNHPDIPEWQHSILMTTLKAGKLVSLKLSSDGLSITGQSEWFVNNYGRLRDICISPDGRIFIAVSNRDGRGTPRPGDDRIVQIRIVDSTSAEELPILKNSLRINPNPVTNISGVYFETLLKAFEYTIVNQLGQTVQHGPVLSANLELNSADFYPGYYIIRVTGESGSLSAPFIVQ